MRNNSSIISQVKIDIMGRIQIPKPVRNKLGITDGEMLDLEVGTDSLTIKKINRPPSDPRRTIEFYFDEKRISVINERKKKFRPGAFVKNLSMENEDNPIPLDMVGIVSKVDDVGSVHVEWKNGRRVASLCIPGDAIEIISEKEYNSYKC